MRDGRLRGSRCTACGTVTFPHQDSCPRCTSSQTEEHLLATEGTLWTWTVQRFPHPRFTGEDFEPYGVGYVDLGDVRVQSRLTATEGLEIGMAMTLVQADPYAFAPA